MTKRVLIVDDSDSVRSRVKQALQDDSDSIEFIEAEDGAKGFRILAQKAVDLILCDLEMPQIDGFRFLQLKKSRPEFDEIPVIMLTGKGEVRAKVAGLQAGASDYLTKPFDDEELRARVNIHLKIKRLQDELRDKNARLEMLNRIDPLTQILNRGAFEDTLSKEFARAKRYGVPFVFCILDIDHFKQVNDTFGHQAGDSVLVQVAQALHQVKRANDTVARYGGEEFTFLMPHTEMPGGMRAAERCLEMLRNLEIVEDDLRIKITASMGIIAYPTFPVTHLDALFRHADKALYQAKESGRDRAIYADPNNP